MNEQGWFRSTIYSLGGRKFLMALGATIAVALHAKLGLSEDAILAICGLAAAFILGEGSIDAIKALASKAKDEAPKLLAILVVGLMCFGMVGCGSSQQASGAVAAMEASAISYDRNMTRIVDAFIDDYRAKAVAEADRLAENALKAEVKIVNGEALANPKNLQLILEKKAQHYAAIERNVIEMRKKIVTAHKDIDHLLAYSKGLQSYFEGKAQAAEILNHSSEQVLQFLDHFVGKKD